MSTRASAGDGPTTSVGSVSLTCRASAAAVRRAGNHPPVQAVTSASRVDTGAQPSRTTTVGPHAICAVPVVDALPGNVLGRTASARGMSAATCTTASGDQPVNSALADGEPLAKTLCRRHAAAGMHNDCASAVRLDRLRKCREAACAHRACVASRPIASSARLAHEITAAGWWLVHSVSSTAVNTG